MDMQSKIKNSTVNWDDYLNTRTTNAYTDHSIIDPFLKGKVLEVGCGFGDFAKWMIDVCKCNVSGIDPSGEAIAHAKQIAPSGHFSVGVAEKLEFQNNSFDVLISLEVVEHLTNPQTFFDEAYRVVSDGGRILIQTPNYPIKRLYDFLYYLRGVRTSLSDDPTHVSPFSFSRMRKYAIKSGFKIEKLVGRNIMGENKLKFLKSQKDGFLAPLLSQKMILIAKK